MNKLKLSLIAIATLVASNTNAQTFYQCVPNTCPDGLYFDGEKCKCPANYTEYDGECCLSKITILMEESMIPSWGFRNKNGARIEPTIEYAPNNYGVNTKMARFTIGVNDCLMYDLHGHSDKNFCWTCHKPKI